MKHIIRIIIVLILASWSPASLAESEIHSEALEFHAYFRSGAAISQGLSEGVCYHLPGAPTEFSRFGNECSLYSEIFMSKAYQTRSGVQFKGHFTVAFASDGNATWEDTSAPQNDLIVAHREAYIEAIGIFSEQSSVWAGKRFYNRYYLEMWDYFLLNQNGTGFGLEKLPMGFAQANFAVFRHFSQEADSPNTLTADLRLQNLSLVAGKLGLAIIYGQQSAQGRQTAQTKWSPVNGQQYTLDYSFIGSKWHYRSYFQYGLGLYGGRPELNYGYQTGSTIQIYDASAFDRSEDGQQAAKAWQNSSTIRWIHDLQYAGNGSALHWNLALAWTRVDFGKRRDEKGELIPVRDTFAAGIHPVLFLNDIWGLDADIYYAHIENGLPRQNFDGTSEEQYIRRALGKASLGLVFRPSASFQLKPQIRLYGTYAIWNKLQRGDRLITNGSQVYHDEIEGYTVGVQGEVWW